jgi:predicted nucleotidyltransferase
MNKEVLNKISEIKEQFLAEGFIIEGIFGSYSRDDFNQFSDIDILYDLDKVFKDKYKGFKAIAQLDDIQRRISLLLNIKADLVQKSTLGAIATKYILPEVYYV